jgi:hypothetical protein
LKDFLDEVIRESTDRDSTFPLHLAAATARRNSMSRERLHPHIPAKRTNLPKNIQACIYYGLNDDRDAPNLALSLVLMNIDAEGFLRGTPIELVMHCDPPPLGDAATTISLRTLAGWLEGGDQIETIDRCLSICVSSKLTPFASVHVEWDERPVHDQWSEHRVNLRLTGMDGRVDHWHDFSDIRHTRWQQLLDGEVVDDE